MDSRTPEKASTGGRGLSSIFSPVSKRSIDFDYWSENQKESPVKKAKVEEEEDTHVKDITEGSNYGKRFQFRVTVRKAIEKKNFRGQDTTTLIMHGMDKSGDEICIIAYNEQSAKLLEKIKINSCFLLKNFDVQLESGEHPNHTDSKFKIVLNRSSVIEELSSEESSALPGIPFRFETIDKIGEKGTDGLIDIIGIAVKNWGEKVRKHKKIRELTLTDTSKKCTRVTLWGDSASQFGDDKEVVVALRKATIKEYDGILYLEGSTFTLDWKNPNVPEAEDLLSWFLEEKKKKKMHED